MTRFVSIRFAVKLFFERRDRSYLREYDALYIVSRYCERKGIPKDVDSTNLLLPFHFRDTAQDTSDASIQSQPHLVLPFAKGGDLFQTMRHIVQQKCDVFTNEEIRVVSLGIVKGTLTLQKARLVHFDLKPNNVLITHIDDENGRISNVTLCDLGVSVLSGTKSPRVQVEGFGAPETRVAGHSIDAALDVFALGAILLEMVLVANGVSMISSKELETLQEPCEYGKVLLQNFKIDMPHVSKFTLEMVSLVGKCWSCDPDQRPSPEDLVRVFENFAVEEDEIDSTPH